MIRPYRVMENYRYVEISYDAAKAMSVFKAITESQAYTYMASKNDMSGEPVISALRQDATLVATLTGVSFEDWNVFNRSN